MRISLTHINPKKTIARASTLAKAERNDCFVYAVAVATGLNYDQAHQEVAARFERKPGRGVRSLHVLERLKPGQEIGSRQVVEVITKPSKTYKLYGELVTRAKRVASFAKEHPTGTYIILTRNHALTIKEGVVYDNLSKPSVESLVRYAFKVQ